MHLNACLFLEEDDKIQAVKEDNQPSFPYTLRIADLSVCFRPRDLGKLRLAITQLHEWLEADALDEPVEYPHVDTSAVEDEFDF